MRLSELQFGALLSYCPQGDSNEIQYSKNVMLWIKGDRFVGKPPILMSQWIAQTILNQKNKLSFFTFFQPDTILIPTPKSSLMQPDTLWVPERIATALVKIGLGKEVVSCLVRRKSVPKSASSSPSKRPTDRKSVV